MWQNLTNFTNAECFPQASGLVLHRPFLEQLFEHGRLCAIVDGLYVGAAGITLHLDEIQGFGHGRLFLHLGGSFAFPYVDLGATLVQDIAVLNQAGRSMVTQIQDTEDLPLKLLLDP